MNLIIAVVIFFTVLYLLAVYKNDYSLVDVGWGISFCIPILVGMYEVKGVIDTRIIVVSILICLWALRLSGYILYRNIKLGKEDYRYTEMRKGWGEKVKIRAYTNVFLLQALISLFLGLPLYLMFFRKSPEAGLRIYDYVGIIIWSIGFLIEAIADFQKNKFKNNPHNTNKIMNKGLWKYSRHPNYFGECLLWWGVGIILFQTTTFYYAFYSPFILNLLIIFFSGVALLEKKKEKNPEYEFYKKETSIFVPWPPRSRK